MILVWRSTKFIRAIFTPNGPILHQNRGKSNFVPLLRHFFYVFCLFARFIIMLSGPKMVIRLPPRHYNAENLTALKRKIINDIDSFHFHQITQNWIISKTSNPTWSSGLNKGTTAINRNLFFILDCVDSNTGSVRAERATTSAGERSIALNY